MSNSQKSKPAVQLVLGSQAITFPLEVPVKKLDGTEALLTITCKAMRKTAWAKVRDEYHAAIIKAASERNHIDPAETDAQTQDDPVESVTQHGLQSVVNRGLQTDADLVLKFASDWDLAVPLVPSSLRDLEDEFGGTLSKIISGFEAAIYQGRLGN